MIWWMIGKRWNDRRRNQTNLTRITSAHPYNAMLFRWLGYWMPCLIPWKHMDLVYDMSRAHLGRCLFQIVKCIVSTFDSEGFLWTSLLFDSWFWRLSIIRDCPDNWFRRLPTSKKRPYNGFRWLSMTWNCPYNWFWKLSISWNFVWNMFTVLFWILINRLYNW